MTRTQKILTLAAALFMGAGMVQAESTPVAIVYVASNPKDSSNNEIVAFAADKNGKLTPVAGSPFSADVSNMAVNGKYLFGTNRNGLYIEAYKIATNGSLGFAAQTDITKYNSDNCGQAGPLFLDHTGASLYDMEFNGDGCSNNDYHSFGVVKSSGKLNDLGTKAINDWLYLPATFISNNTYAYTASCIADMYWGIYGYKRSSSGVLSQIGISAPVPQPPSGHFYCPSQAAADPTNHVAISMEPVNQESFTVDGKPQIVSFTASSSGNLSTTNTRSNMPYTDVVSVTDLAMSPSGKLLAVSGTGGLQIFHFNGASPATHYTGLLTHNPVDQMFWDNADHLYAISNKAGKLYVFTVTPTGYKQASGSPYTVSSPKNIIVQPQPWW